MKRKRDERGDNWVLEHPLAKEFALHTSNTKWISCKRDPEAAEVKAKGIKKTWEETLLQKDSEFRAVSLCLCASVCCQECIGDGVQHTRTWKMIPSGTLGDAAVSLSDECDRGEVRQLTVQNLQAKGKAASGSNE